MKRLGLPVLCLAGSIALSVGAGASLGARPSIAARAAIQIGPMSIFSPPPTRGVSNGASDHTAFSQDNRDVRIVAFDSTATNLVAGDSNGRRDVFAMLKARATGSLGGRIARVSVGDHGRQANGDSSRPSVDGTTGAAPHCIAFESTATNLVPGAGTRRSRIYLRDLRAGRTSLVSSGSGVDPSIDGRCGAVAFRAGAWVMLRDLRRGALLRLARGRDPDLETDGQGIAYNRGGQIYYRALTRRSGVLAPSGRELLVSATAHERRGNGASTDPAVDDHGRHIAFQTTATNLCPDQCPYPYVPAAGDSNGPVSDILLRTMGTVPRHETRMHLVSGDPSGQPTLASTNPAISRAGRQIAYQQAGTWEQQGRRPGVNVLAWYWPNNYLGKPWLIRTPGTELISANIPPSQQPITLFNGPSTNPSISSRGNYIAFTSGETGDSGERNGAQIPDVFIRFVGGNTDGLPTH